MSWIKNLTLVFISFAISIFIAEFAVRIGYGMLQQGQSVQQAVSLVGNPAAYFEESEWKGSYSSVSKMRFYSKAGYRPLENWNESGIFNNEIGLRSRKSIQEINSLSDILVVSGGSTAWGAGVKQKDMYTTYMGAISAGVGGYLFANELSFMRDIVSKAVDVDHWVSLSGWNDVYASYRGESYYVSPDMFNLESVVYQNPPSAKWPQITKPLYATDALSYDQYNIKLNYLFARAWAKIVGKKVEYVALIPSEDEKIHRDISPMSYDRFIQFFAEEVIQAAYWSKVNGIKFTFALQPSLYSTAKKLHQNEVDILTNNKAKFPELDRYFESFYQRLRLDLKLASVEHDFTFIDADRAFDGSSDDDAYFIDHVHFGSKGNKKLGEYLSDNIERY